MAGVQTLGLKETIRAFERAGGDIDDMKDEFYAMGSRVSSKSKSMAPRRSGDLANSVRPSRRKNSIVIMVGGAKVPYAKHVLFGTKYMRGFNFVYRALDYMDLESDLPNAVNRVLSRAGLK